MKNADAQILPRDFKGIWIPREIWTHSELSYFEKVLWAEIDSLDRPEEGCTASNEYFCKFFNEHPKAIQRGISKLKRLELILQESFDGRHRKLRSLLRTSKDKFDHAGGTKTSGLRGQNCPSSLIGDFIERENKVENKDIDLPPLPPPKKEPDLIPTKEEEEELLKRLQQRTKDFPKIRSMKQWRQAVLKDMREEGIRKGNEGITSKGHMRQALIFDGKKINGDLITALKDRVEFSYGSQCTVVYYDLPDAEWKKQTERWFKS